MESTRRAEVSVNVWGVDYRVAVRTDGPWSEWYEEAIWIDDSERDLCAHYDNHARDLYDNIMQAVDMEVHERLRERALA